ncbi:TatD family hydrolase [Vibrio sp.]|uniref:TatD family hydrolase n=1 Tax=Vibrio sp. TaxID=678 RepID=UPI003D12BDBA
MSLFDTHCHFDFAPFAADFALNWQQAQAQGVKRMVIPAVGESNWHRIDQLSRHNHGLYYALGWHPHFLQGEPDVALDLLAQALESRTEQCIAVGECGLDFAIDTSPERQEQFFTGQIELALRLQLPLIIHSRKAHNRILQLLKQYHFNAGGILHAFSGSYQQAMQFVELGFYIGVGGVITYPRANKTRHAVKRLPLECLVLETDAPDMPICGRQGMDNHPKWLQDILYELADLKETSAQTIAPILWRNSHRAFNICK